MELTKEQIESVQNGEVVRISTDDGELVIVAAKVYDKLTKFSADESNPRETYPAVLKAWDAAGSSDDATAYQDLA